MRSIKKSDIVAGLKTAMDAKRTDEKTEAFDYSWLDGNKDWKIKVETSGKLDPKLQTAPKIERRAEQDQLVQLTIKMLVSKVSINVEGKTIEINLEKRLRHEIINSMEGDLDKTVFLPKRVLLYAGGETSIDIGDSKVRAIEHIKAKYPGKKIYYFGDEFQHRGNDLSALRVEGVTAINVGGENISEEIDRKKVDLITAGDKPDHAWLLLDMLVEKILKETEAAEADKKVKKDGAMITKAPSEAKYGGIDLNARWLDLDVKRYGDEVPLPFQQQEIKSIPIEGLVPVIINISPINISHLLKMVNKNQGAERELSLMN